MININMHLAELGKMVEMVDFLEIAKTNKDYNKAERSVKSFLNSISLMRNQEVIPANYTLLKIDRTFNAKTGIIKYSFDWREKDGK